MTISWIEKRVDSADVTLGCYIPLYTVGHIHEIVDIIPYNGGFDFVTGIALLANGHKISITDTDNLIAVREEK